MKLISIILSAFLICSCSTIEKGFVEISGGARLYYEEKGKGSPVIFLHGHSLDTRMWDGQFDVLAKNHRAIRFDFRGYGRSSEQVEGFQFTHLDDLVTLMDSLHIDKAHIVGLSMGGFIGSEMLAIYPQRMISATLASGLIHSSKGPSQPMDSAEIAKRDREIAALKKRGVEKMKQEWLDNLVASGGTQREKIRRPLKKMIADWSAWQPLHKEARVLYAKDAYDKLKAEKSLIPTLIIMGNAEGMPKRPQMLDFLPNGKFVIMDDCGHMLNMEKPREFNSLLSHFIDSIDIANIDKK
ncbi:MAG: alpha/beta hydrolase [Prevotella sp.]|nr:alpha/beta hydrolase [Prevotella sp.]